MPLMAVYGIQYFFLSQFIYDIVIGVFAPHLRNQVNITPKFENFK